MTTQMEPVRLLTAGFEGYFMCRLATDPDPNNEPRGRSGYTMALTTEEPLDQVIRLQPDDHVDRNMRDPAEVLNRKVGVTVRSVTFDGASWKGVHPLMGAKVSLHGKTDVFSGPIFESRNNIVGSDDSMAMVVNPFELEIANGDVRLHAVDHLNPANPKQEIWEIDNPALYGRRFPTRFDSASAEAQQAISVFDGYAYFRGRRAFLADEIERLTGELATLPARDDDEAREKLKLKIEQARTRIYQLEFWGDRVINKLGFLVEWEFDINGDQTAQNLGGRVGEGQPWHVRFWFGAWDGDLLIGYMRGTLSIPFEPD